MKTGQIFWGVFFLTFGTVLLLTKMDLLVMNWSFVWDFWPLILILWGLLIIFKKTTYTSIISAVFGLLIALLIFGIIHNISENTFSDKIEWNDSQNINYFSEEMSPIIQNAHFELNAGGGYFKISDGTDKLISGKAKGIFSSSDFRVDTNGNNANLYFEMNDGEFKIHKGSFKNSLSIELNNLPVWDFDIETGAAKSEYDFSNLKVASVKLKTGAAKTSIKFSELYDDVKVNIEMGAAKLIIKIPQNVGCRISGDMTLVAKDFSGFDKTEDYYQTKDFENAKKKIDINVEGGVSSIVVERY